MPAYDTNNPFAKILRGEFPCHKVYEDEHVLAFLDIMPRSPGHTLVIPKAPARNILDITPDDYAHVARAAHKIAAAAMKAFKADGITIQQFNESAGGQVVRMEREDDRDGKWRYEVVVKTNGKEWGFEVDPNGKFVRKHENHLAAR